MVKRISAGRNSWRPEKKDKRVSIQVYFRKHENKRR